MFNAARTQTPPRPAAIFPAIEIIEEFGAEEKNPQNELIAPPVKRRSGQRAWTPEQRLAAAERARKSKPWNHATGPKTAEGKARASKNAIARHIEPDHVIDWYLHEQAKFIRAINRWIDDCQKCRDLDLPEPKFAFAPTPYLTPSPQRGEGRGEGDNDAGGVSPSPKSSPRRGEDFLSRPTPAIKTVCFP